MGEIWKDRLLLIASCHGKEKAIAPLLEQQLAVRCVTIENLNTDQFGTFSGEISRTDDPVTTVRKKCRWAMEQYGFDLALASEGSFGPHPSAFFIPANEEWLILIDQRNQLEILAREVSAETNFLQATLYSLDELEGWLQKARFPSHGVIIRPTEVDYKQEAKGLHDIQQVQNVARFFLDRYGSFYIHTDMRAMHNPSRMKVIEKTTHTLLHKIHSTCPQCAAPGFELMEYIPGLPCASCGLPTREPRSVIFRCAKCTYEIETKNLGQPEAADPVGCDYCNP
jgi:hypothetical protein